MNECLIGDTSVYVMRDGHDFHVVLQIGVDEFDITETVLMNEAVEDAIMSLEAMKEKPI